MNAQELEEMTVFLEFAQVCPLALLPETAKNRKPPEPDILCGLNSGENIAFELVSAANETADKARPGKRVPDEKVFLDVHNLRMALGEAYFAALSAGTIINPERFHFHTIHVYFEDSASFKKSMKAIPDVIAMLRDVKHGANVIRRGVVRSIVCDPYPIPCSYDGPMFFANTSAMNVGITVVQRIKDKLEKKYETEHPIHLLVWSSSTIAAEVDFWRSELLSVISAEGMGPFQYLWVFGRHKASIVFELAR